MVPIMSLTLPTVLAAVFVFIASSIIHMLLPYHKSDYKKLPDEDAVRNALKPQNLAPGCYNIPSCTHENMKTPEMQEKFKQGPVGLLNIMPSGAPNMGKFLGAWIVYCLVVCHFTAYVAAHTLAAGTPYLAVFRIVGAVAFMAFGVGNIPNAIWRGMTWTVVMKEVIDGILYACLVAGTFGWLWPKG